MKRRTLFERAEAPQSAPPHAPASTSTRLSPTRYPGANSPPRDEQIRRSNIPLIEELRVGSVAAAEHVVRPLTRSPEVI